METCKTCKGWGGQGMIGLKKEKSSDFRYCGIDLFGGPPMFRWVVTFGSMGGSKGSVNVHCDFGCVNHDPIFDKSSQQGAEADAPKCDDCDDWAEQVHCNYCGACGRKIAPLN